MKNSRFVALSALICVDLNKSYSNIIINNEIDGAELDKKDAALASCIFYGVLERKLELDNIISKYSNTSLKKIDTSVLNILRMGIYQILYMSKIPNSAAVNESVKLTTLVKKKSASSFVNGILRNVERNKDKNYLPNQMKDRLEYLSLKYSTPIWIIKMWDSFYGKNCCEKLLQSMLGTPPIIARVNILKISTDKLIEYLKDYNIFAEKLKLDNAILINGVGSICKLEPFLKGYFHIQDLSSQICCNILNPLEGETIVDVCAAPGGKSFTIAQMMKNKGKVLSFDLHKPKVDLISNGAKRLGISIIDCSVRDASKKDNNLIKADKVLCDVPCSGLGIIRRKPEIKYKDNVELEKLPDLQYNILCNSEKFVKEEGILIYSTCTLNQHENGNIADKFLNEYKNYEPFNFNLPYGIKRAINEPQNQLTLMPHVNATDGFFIAAFKKRS